MSLQVTPDRGGDHTAPAASGGQVEIAWGDQQAWIAEVGGGLRAYSAGGRDVLDGYAAHEMCRSARGQCLVPWPNRVRDGRYEFAGLPQQLPLTEPERQNAIHGLARWVNWTLAHQSEDFAECRNAGTRNGTLVGKLRRVGAARTNLTHVVLLHFLQSQVDEGRAGSGDVTPIRAAREIWVEAPLVRYHDRVVFGDTHVELQGVDAQGQRVGERLQCVLGAQPAPATVRLDVEAPWSSARNACHRDYQQKDDSISRHD